MGLRIAFAPGVTPAKWFRVWEERFPDRPLEPLPLTAVESATAEALSLLATDAADVALVRLPVPADGLHAIPLYTEQAVVVVPKDHESSLLEEVSFADLDELARLDRANGSPGLQALTLPGAGAVGAEPDGEASTGVDSDVFELVAAGVGYVVVPKSVARLHSRRDVVSRDLVGPGADTHETRVALVWRAAAAAAATADASEPPGASVSPDAASAEEREHLIDEFVGVVRGRTANSTRSAATTEAIAAAKAQKPTAAAKARAAEARAAAPRKKTANPRTGGSRPAASRTSRPTRKRRPR